MRARSTIPALVGSSLRAATALYVGDPSDLHHSAAPRLFLPQEDGELTQVDSQADWAASIFADAAATPAPRVQHFLEWNSASAKRFALLAEKEALEIATQSELDELETLSLVRRRKVAPRSGVDVLHEFEERELIRDLLRSLNRYVQFENRTNPRTPSPSRQGSDAQA